MWLTERLGEVTILSASEPVAAEEFTLAAEDEERGVGLEPPPAPNPAPEAHPADVRCCTWIVDTSGETFRWCGEHRRQYAGTLGAAAIARDWLPPLNSVANSDGGVDWFLLLDATASATLTNGPGRLILLGRVSIDEAFIAVGLGLPANMKRAVA